jgi:TM2 domain-containing membrane protein YozV
MTGRARNQDTHSILVGYVLWIFGFMGAHRCCPLPGLCGS